MKKDSKQRLFEVMLRLDKTFKPKLNESTDQDRYEDVVFIQGEEADEPLQILNTQGEDAALNYLKQWHEHGSHMGSNELGHGSDDEIYEKDGYIMSWNPRIGYIGLQYDLGNMNEMETTDDNNFDFDDPKHGQDAEAMFKSNLKGFDKNYQPQDRVNKPTQKNTYKKSGDGESELKEGRKDINPKYTHFALLKDAKKFVNGWDFADVDPQDLKQDKMHYFFQDIIDMDIEPKNVVIGTARKFQREGLNPFDSNNWYKFNTDGWEEKDDLKEISLGLANDASDYAKMYADNSVDSVNFRLNTNRAIKFSNYINPELVNYAKKFNINITRNGYADTIITHKDSQIVINKNGEITKEEGIYNLPNNLLRPFRILMDAVRKDLKIKKEE